MWVTLLTLKRILDERTVNQSNLISKLCSKHSQFFFFIIKLTNVSDLSGHGMRQEKEYSFETLAGWQRGDTTHSDTMCDLVRGRGRKCRNVPPASPS